MEKQTKMLMGPAEKLGEALAKRGFLARVQEDRVIFSTGNGKQDLMDVRHLLEHHGIPVCYSGNQMQVLSPVMPLEVLRAVEVMPVRYGRSSIPNAFDSWKAFTKRNHGLRWNTLSLDKGIAFLVKALSEAGILVTGGCDGHGRHEPRIYFASVWAAAWFRVVSERILQRQSLNYEWKVVISTNGSPSLQAALGENTKWTARAIRQDTVSMAFVLRESASQLRALRRTSFKNRSMRKQAEALSQDFEGLCQWMTTLLNEKETQNHA
ncbi:hypothetical protein ACHHV8_28965 [Paenibacillus sp. TAB 01]|uniref:hypothetical protein n=1 Tax=Paenibacillus sp. TAB 01 TaxID=3368988 RepID=UPI00375158BF